MMKNHFLFRIFIFILILFIFSPVPHVFSNKWQLALPGYKYEFPNEHRSHPNFKIEWWYFSGNVKDEKGNKYTFMLTFFRRGLRFKKTPSAIKSKWALDNLYFSHFSLYSSKTNKHYFSEKFSRGALDQAGASNKSFKVWIDDWKAEIKDPQKTNKILIFAKENKLYLDFELEPQKSPVIHGTNGISQKSAGLGQASHYYSYTRLKVNGSLSVDGKRILVNGSAWMDHEFGSNQLGKDQIGWDWFSIQLSNNTELMLYLMRNKKGSYDFTSSGSLIESDGSVRHISLNDFSIKNKSFWRSKKTKASYPVEWEIEVPKYDIKLKIKALHNSQELDTSKSTQIIYWEGGIEVEGLSQGIRVNGVGFVEMTGYAKYGRPKF